MISICNGQNWPIPPSVTGVYDVKKCTVGDDHFLVVSLATFARGQHFKALQRSLIWFVPQLFARERHYYAGRATR